MGDNWQAMLDGGDVLLIDGGMGTELQRRGVPMDTVAWSGAAVLTHPDAVRETHEDYIRAGARVIITNTFGSTRQMLEPAGYATHWDSAAQYLRVFYQDLLPPTASHESSMLQDIRAGRPSEVDALCGAVSQLGTQHGIATPVNTSLTQLIHALEKK